MREIIFPREGHTINLFNIQIASSKSTYMQVTQEMRGFLCIKEFVTTINENYQEFTRKKEGIYWRIWRDKREGRNNLIGL